MAGGFGACDARLSRQPRNLDIHGRKLRVLMRDGQSLGDILIAQGLARSWDGARRSWCR